MYINPERSVSRKSLSDIFLKPGFKRNSIYSTYLCQYIFAHYIILLT